MAEVLATWDSFDGGHWGALGPSKANENQWGGVNMMLSRQGGLIPTCASRWLQLNANPLGKIWGMHWAWGADGRVYYVQQKGTSVTQSNVYRFTPDPTNLPNTITTTTTFAFVPTTSPDWVNVGTTVYVTFYGNSTYQINTSNNTFTKVTGSYGAAPAGRAIALYGERLMVGGISDTRFGVHANRVIFSGDDTNDDPTDRTKWETLNFFDLGADNSFITGLYVIRDFLVAITQDQQIWVLTGSPGTTLAARRVYGFNKASGGLTAFLATHASVDPSQTKLWFYDHSQRGPVRFNGANVTRTPIFGIPHGDREGDDLVEGAMTMHGGPDEFIMHGVSVPRSAGSGVDNRTLELLRIGGVWTLVQNDNIASRA